MCSELSAKLIPSFVLSRVISTQEPLQRDLTSSNSLLSSQTGDACFFDPEAGCIYNGYPRFPEFEPVCGYFDKQH